MDEDDFDMTSHSNLLTKKLQIQALRQVREAAVKSFKALNDEEKRMHRIMSTSSSNRGSINLQESSDTYQYQSIPPGLGTITFTPSQVEHTLYRYTAIFAMIPNLTPWIYLGV